MSQESDKYLYFKVGLLKESFTTEALRQYASKYHMIDQPGRLIALRLTEYYEMKSQGVSLPTTTSLAGPSAYNGVKRGGTVANGASGDNGASAANGLVGADHAEEIILTASTEADQNAEEAADYWTLL